MSADYFFHGATLTLAWFLGVNLMISAAAAIAATVMNKRVESQHAARWWLSVRLAPAAVALAFALALFVPSYWLFEPREGVEGFDWSLTLAAAAAVIVGGLALVRGAKAWIGARRRVREWMRHAHPIAVGASSIPAFAVEADQPMIALVGVLRPRLLVTRGLIDALTPAELRAAVEHELGHQRSLDNLKRLLMRAAPDVLICFDVAREIERRWAAAAEHAADRIGGVDVADARCALASALVKVARLTPTPVPRAEPISTLISGGDIASRVRCLLNDDSPLSAASKRRTSAAVVAAAAVAAFAIAYGPLLHSVHDVTELLVRSLP